MAVMGLDTFMVHRTIKVFSQRAHDVICWQSVSRGLLASCGLHEGYWLHEIVHLATVKNGQTYGLDQWFQNVLRSQYPRRLFFLAQQGAIQDSGVSEACRVHIWPLQAPRKPLDATGKHL